MTALFATPEFAPPVRRREAAGGAGTAVSVMDVLLLLALSFIALGGLIGVLSALKLREGPLAEYRDVRQQLDELATAITGLETRRAGLLDSIGAAQQELAALEPAPAAVGAADMRIRKEGLQRAVADLGRQVESERQRLERLEREQEDALERIAEMNGDVNKKLAGLAEQQQTLRELKRQRQSVQPQAKLTGGWPRVNRRTPSMMYGFILKGNRVFPISDDFFSGEAVIYQPGVVHIWLKQNVKGLAADEAVSYFAKHENVAAYRRSGRIIMLVNADSFGVFRELRQKIVDMGIDYGWEPHKGTDLYMSESGRSIPGQGR